MSDRRPNCFRLGVDPVPTTGVSQSRDVKRTRSRPLKGPPPHAQSAGRALAAPTQPSAPANTPTAARALSGNSPVVAFVNSAIARAYEDGASDIHFETDRQGVHVKYRLDVCFNCNDIVEYSAV